jgi:UDP-N-acetylmuramoyl-L-alanyl-D-glutamate--2,6-diaminopimelate ligase
MEVQTPTGKLHLDLALRGHFHLQNVLAAVATGCAMGIGHEIIIDAVREVRVPGRFDAVDRGQDFAVILDFAHTPDGLEKVLKSAREFTKRQLICVFGCDGDRDRGKRPPMGHVAAVLADFSIVTTGHPRTEDPDEIIAAILPGIGTAPHQVEPDRRKAITMAIRRAMPGDMVVIAGKGRQTYQEIGHEKVSFDEYEVTVSALDELLMAPGRNTDH